VSPQHFKADAGNAGACARRCAGASIWFFTSRYTVYQMTSRSEAVISDHAWVFFDIGMASASGILQSRVVSHTNAAGFPVNASLCWPSDP
jgi:hypothetical protein